MPAQLGEPMNVSVEHIGAQQFEVKARNQTLICDQPSSQGGFDEGMTPPELMLASLGTCAAYYAVDYLNSIHKEAGSGLRVRVTGRKAPNPARIGSFEIEVETPFLVSESERRGLKKAIDRCLIHNTLMHPPAINVYIVDESLQAGAA